MSNQENCLLVLFVGKLKQFQGFFRILPVQVAGGFIGKKNCGPVNQAPGDSCPLLLPAGSFPRIVRETVRKPQGIYKIFKTALIRLLSVKKNRKQNIFPYI